jgi:ubiquinone/menaquinone biosynthesis C-methylase UbiE
MSERKTWTPSDVVDVSGPAALLRNYLEQGYVRDCITRVAGEGRIRIAYDVGCGFGRLTPVLAEQAARVVGFEREAQLVETARRLLPNYEFIQVASLEQLPVPDHSAEFVMIFTVLQHMPDWNAEAVIEETLRVLAPGGFVLVVEETDAALEAGDAEHAEFGYTKGRSWSWYARHFEPLRLIRMAPRIIEPGYPRADVGTYMLFGPA